MFRGKTILLPCDDPKWSNFTKFFAAKFVNLGIKKLISTSYAQNSKPFKTSGLVNPTEGEDPKIDPAKELICGKIYTLSHDKNGDNNVDIDDLDWEYLQGDGDFRSEEVLNLRNEADIIITNPPFSLFREFLAWVVEADKQFVIIGNINAITYKEVFPLIKDNKIWLGNGFHAGNAYFSTPVGKEYATGVYDAVTGLVKFRNCCWFTSLDHGRRHQPLQLMTMADNLKFNKKMQGKTNYDSYDNYNAIEVPFTNAIPSDYDGVMGVPISFLDKYNPDQFEVLGCDYDVKEGRLPKIVNSNWNGKIDRGYINGVRIYSRILIKHKRKN